MVRIAQIELTKYVRTYVVIIICYALGISILLSRIAAKNFSEYGTFDFETFKAVNHSFTAMFSSAFPFTIMLNICNELSSGYTSKLISNGLSRRSYCTFKFTLAGALSLVCLVLYMLVVGTLVLIQRTTYVDWTILLSSSIQVILFSMFFSSIAVSLALLGRNWQSALLFYYGYATIEAIFVVRFEDTASWVKFLPFNAAHSIFELKAIPERFLDYLVPASIIVPFCFVIVWSAYHFFEKAEL